MLDVERVLELAAMTPEAWQRRDRLRMEHAYVRKKMPHLSEQQAIARWIVIALSIRAPTTVISYARTLVSAVVGCGRNLDSRTKSVMEGLVTLYGTRAWYQQLPDITKEEIAKVVADETLPRWVRVRADTEYHSISRDADLTYLQSENVKMDRKKREVEINFPFLKNDQSGTFGVIKIMTPLNWEMVEGYLDMVREQEWETIFPQKIDEFTAWLRKSVDRKVGTRGIRRGAAVEAGKVATPEVVQSLLAHKDVATQRTYTRQLTEHEKRQHRAVQMALHGGSDGQMTMRPPPSSLIPQQSKNTTTPPPLPQGLTPTYTFVMPTGAIARNLIEQAVAIWSMVTAETETQRTD